MITQEISEKSVKEFSLLHPHIQGMLSESICAKCDAPLKKDLDYVVCKNGKVVWWCKNHYPSYPRQMCI